ncbi:DUF1292 domain-containing protein [bacterium]|nr:DUF1292 domain-containing protein [bacterium]
MTTKDEIIEITANDGKVTECELFDMVGLHGKFYALLVEAGHMDDEEPELFIMRYREVGADVFFEAIEDEDEFKEVSEYVESLPDANEE